jgi:hypothetical protein
LRIEIPGDPNDLLEALRHADWVVIGNFEPGQPAYAAAIISRFTEDDFARSCPSANLDLSVVPQYGIRVKAFPRSRLEEE